MNKIVIITDGDSAHLEYIIDMYNHHLKDEYTIKSFSFVRTMDNVLNALQDASNECFIVVYAIVNISHANFIRDYCLHNNLRSVNFFRDYDNILKDQFKFTDYEKDLDEEYFNRVECIEFTIDNDDGKTYRNILKADLVILGISRTGKTPLSIYLALKGFRVVNIPLFVDMNVPEELFKIDKKKVFGLINSVDKIASIRKNRVHDSTVQYAKPEYVLDELQFAFELYEKIGCDIIDTEDYAVEEVAHYIENIVKG